MAASRRSACAAGPAAHHVREGQRSRPRPAPLRPPPFRLSRAPLPIPRGSSGHTGGGAEEGSGGGDHPGGGRGGNNRGGVKGER